jgi:putative ABC transport system permease protein
MNRRLLAHSLRAVLRFRLRSALIALGALVGTGALVLVVSIGDAARRKILDTVQQLFGASAIMVMGGGALQAGGPHGSSARLTLADLEAVAAEVPGIELWDPQLATGASVRFEGETATVRLLGHSERSERAWNRSVTSGEYFDAAAVASAARVALVGETVARELFGDRDPVGEEILVDAVPCRVLGVLEPFGTDLHGLDRDDEVVVPITTLMRRVLETDAISSAQILADDPARSEELAAEVRRVLRERHRLPEGRADDFRIITPVAVQGMVARSERVLRLWLPLAAAIALLVGGIVTASLMLASVSARTAEIGLRRAVGARPGEIRGQFLVETAATMLAGGLAGVLAGWAGAQLAANRFHMGDVFSWPAVLLGLGAALLVGLLAGVLPARRAARLDPAVALR